MELIIVPDKNQLSPLAAQTEKLLAFLKPLAAAYTEKSDTGVLFLNADIKWLKEHITQINEISLVESDIIDEAIAVDWITEFSNRFNKSCVFSAAATVIQGFMKDVMAMKIPATYPPNEEIGLRFYMGSKAEDPQEGHPHHIVIVPVYNQTLDTKLPNPVATFEKDWMNPAHGNSFTALLGTGNNENGSLTRLTDAAEGAKHIARKATPSKDTLYYNAAAVSDFVNNAGADFSTFTIEFACTDAEEITMILRCRDAAGNILESTAAGKTGLSFDEGNMIPPPPLADSSF